MVQAASGLVRIKAASDIRSRVKNDIILEMAIAEVTDALYVYIDASDPHASAAYTSELYNVVWDLACVNHKPQLSTTIVCRASSAPTWEDLRKLPEVQVLYDENETVVCENMWETQSDGLHVRYEPLQSRLNLQFDSIMSLFENEEEEEALTNHAVVVVNGTFDRLHHGHKKLLSLATSVCSERLVVGISATPKLLDTKPFAQLIEPLEERKRRVLDFLTALNSALEMELVEVVDSWGPAVLCSDKQLLFIGSTSDFERFAKLQARRESVGLGRILARFVRRTDRSTLNSANIRERVAIQQRHFE